MEEKLPTIPHKPDTTTPKPDVDDLIFQHEAWLTSDR